jgi:hypothetical protein
MGPDRQDRAQFSNVAHDHESSLQPAVGQSPSGLLTYQLGLCENPGMPPEPRGYRGRFGMYLPPLMEALGKVEQTHEPPQQQGPRAGLSRLDLTPRNCRLDTAGYSIAIVKFRPVWDVSAHRNTHWWKRPR